MKKYGFAFMKKLWIMFVLITYDVKLKSLVKNGGIQL
jgi:hypothetical protein